MEVWSTRERSGVTYHCKFVTAKYYEMGASAAALMPAPCIEPLVLVFWVKSQACSSMRSMRAREARFFCSIVSRASFSRSVSGAKSGVSCADDEGISGVPINGSRRQSAPLSGSISANQWRSETHSVAL